MNIFEDKQLTREVLTLDLGDGEVGIEKEYTFYVYNSEFNVELLKIEFIIDSPEVKIVKQPESLKPREVKELVISWTPILIARIGLNIPFSIKVKEKIF